MRCMRWKLKGEVGLKGSDTSYRSVRLGKCGCTAKLRWEWDNMAIGFTFVCAMMARTKVKKFRFRSSG